jgi:hypothetical protein
VREQVVELAEVWVVGCGFGWVGDGGTEVSSEEFAVVWLLVATPDSKFEQF